MMLVRAQYLCELIDIRTWFELHFLCINEYLEATCSNSIRGSRVLFLERVDLPCLLAAVVRLWHGTEGCTDSSDTAVMTQLPRNMRYDID